MRSFNELLQSPRALKTLVAAGSLTVVLVVAAIAAPALVRGKIEREARARGFEAEVGSVRFGLGRVWARSVRVRSPGDDFELRLDAISVGMFSGQVSVLGGSLKGSGDGRRIWEKLRGRATGSGEGAESAGRDLRVDGVHVRWQRDTAVLEAFGVRAERVGGALSFGAELGRASDAEREIQARGVVVGFSAAGGHRRLVRLETSSLELVLRGQAEVEDAPAPSSAGHGAEPEPGGSAQKVATDAPGAPGGELATSRAERLRALRALGLPLLREGLADGASLTLDGVAVRVERGPERLSFGPSRVVVARQGEALQVSLAPSAAEAGVTPLAVSLALPLVAGPLHVAARGGPVSFASLGVRAGQLGLRDVEQATLAVDGAADLSEDFESVELDGKVTVRGLRLQRKELSPQPVGPWSFEAALKARARLDGSELRVLSSELHFGEVRAELSGLVESGSQRRRVEGRLRVPLSGCQSVLEAMPNGLLPLVRDMKLSGSFGVDLQVRYDQQKPQDTRVALSVQNECRVREVPSELSAHRFEQPFLRGVKAPDGSPMTIDGGPGTPSWVSIDDISRHMETAILICEDAGFHAHAGFDFHALENAIKDDLKQGRFARGASTVSMQLAKNLYLGQEKTLGRKLQEALLTLLLEQQLDKRRILELYLNIVELGPGLYGVGDAAQYYFATPARSLTLGQSLYLASLLPNPTYSHFAPNGKLSAGWLNYLHKLMHIAHKIKRIDDAELEAGLAEEIAFRVPGTPSPSPSESNEPPAPPELGEPGAAP